MTCEYNVRACVHSSARCVEPVQQCMGLHLLRIKLRTLCVLLYRLHQESNGASHIFLWKWRHVGVQQYHNNSTTFSPTHDSTPESAFAFLLGKKPSTNQRVPISTFSMVFCPEEPRARSLKSRKAWTTPICTEAGLCSDYSEINSLDGHMGPCT